MTTLRFAASPIALMIQTLAAAAFLMAGITIDALAQTSLAVSPAPPKLDVFERLGNGPDMFVRTRPIGLGPIAVVDLRRIIMQRDGEADWTRTYITPVAEQYLNIGGVPFGTYLLTFCPPDFRRSEAATYRRRITAVLGKIDASLIPMNDRPRQRQILDASDEMLARIGTGVDVPRDELDAFARRLAPLSRANIDAVEADLKTSLDAATTEMRRVLRAGEWERLRIVIIDSDVPYAAQIQYSYFKQLLGREAENRLFFARGSIAIVGGLNAVFPAQSPASRAFFGDLSSGREP